MRVVLLLALLAPPAFCWWTFWPYTEHEDLLDRSIDIAIERWPELTEMDSYRDDLLAGVHDEDFDSDPTNGSYSNYSGLCIAVPGAWWPTATRPLDAVAWVHDDLNPNNWAAALSAYSGSRSEAYDKLGHVLHNLQDLFVSAHAHISPHGLGTGDLVENHSWPAYFDNFEQYCEVTENELGLAQPGRITESELDSLLLCAALFSSTDVESAGFFPSQYYAPPDTAGGWGRYRPYPSGGYPCGNDGIDNDLANAWSLWIVPACCENVAGALRRFWLEANGIVGLCTDASRPRPGPRLPSVLRPGMPLSVPAGSTVALIDASGRVPLGIRHSGFVIPVLPPGVYLCRVTTGSGDFSRPVVVLP